MNPVKQMQAKITLIIFSIRKKALKKAQQSRLLASIILSLPFAKRFAGAIVVLGSLLIVNTDVNDLDLLLVALNCAASLVLYAVLVSFTAKRLALRQQKREVNKITYELRMLKNKISTI